jgi:hypothetical protein
MFSGEQISGGNNCIDCINDKRNSLGYKNDELFTMKQMLLFIENLL